MHTIFLHIPKTAGVTMNRILYREYGNRLLRYTINNYEPEKSITPNLKAISAENRLIAGHFPFGLHEKLPGRARYFTVLRHPVDRTVSHYYFVKKSVDHPLHQHVIGKDIDLISYITGKITAETTHDQVRRLSGLEPAAAGETALARAKNNLESPIFAAAGLTERFDETLLLLKKRLGWKRYPLYRRQNITKKRPRIVEIDPGALQRIERANAWDMQLYRYASARFAQEIRAGFVPPMELLVFRMLNRLYQRYSTRFPRIAKL